MNGSNKLNEYSEHRSLSIKTIMKAPKATDKLKYRGSEKKVKSSKKTKERSTHRKKRKEKKNRSVSQHQYERSLNRRNYRKATRDTSRSTSERSGSKSDWQAQEKNKIPQDRSSWDESDKESPFDFSANDKDRSSSRRSRSKSRSRSKRHRTHKFGFNKTDRNRNENKSNHKSTKKSKSRKYRSPSPDERTNDSSLGFKKDAFASSPRYLPLRHEYDNSYRNNKERRSFNDPDSRSRSPEKDDCRLDFKNDTNTPSPRFLLQRHEDDSSKQRKKIGKFKLNARCSRSPSPDDCRLDFKNNTYAPAPRYLPPHRQDDQSYRKQKKTFNYRDSRSRSPDGRRDKYSSRNNQKTKQIRTYHDRDSRSRSPVKDECRSDFKNNTCIPLPRNMQLSHQNEHNSKQRKNSEKLNIFSPRDSRSVSSHESDCILENCTNASSPSYSVLKYDWSSNNLQEKQGKGNSCNVQATRTQSLVQASRKNSPYERTEEGNNGHINHSYKPLSLDLPLSRQDNRHSEEDSSKTNIAPSSISTSDEFYKQSSDVPTIDLTSDSPKKEVQVVEQQMLTKTKKSFCIDEDIIKQIVDQSATEIASLKALGSSLSFDTEAIKRALTTAEINQNLASTNNVEDMSIMAMNTQPKDTRLMVTQVHPLVVQKEHVKDPKVQELQLVAEEELLRMHQFSAPSTQQCNSYHQPIKPIRHYIQPYRNIRPPTPTSNNISTFKVHSYQPTTVDDKKIKQQIDNVKSQDLSLNIQPISESQRKNEERMTYDECKQMRDVNAYTWKNTSYLTTMKPSLAHIKVSNPGSYSTLVPKVSTKPKSNNFEIPKKPIHINNENESSSVIHIIDDDWDEKLTSLDTQSRSLESKTLAIDQETCSKTKKKSEANENITKRSVNRSRSDSQAMKKSSQANQRNVKPSSSLKEHRNDVKTTTKESQANETITRTSTSRTELLKDLRRTTKVSQANKSVSKPSTSYSEPQTGSRTIKKVSESSKVPKEPQANADVKKHSPTLQNNGEELTSLVDESITALKELMNPNKLLALVGLMGQLSDDTTLTKVKEILEDRLRKDSNNVTTDVSKATKKKCRSELENLYDNTSFIRNGAISARSPTKRRSISPVPIHDTNDLEPEPVRTRRGRSKSRPFDEEKSLKNDVTRCKIIINRELPSGTKNANEPLAKRITQSQASDEYNRKRKQQTDEMKQAPVSLKKNTKNNNPEFHSLVKIVDCPLCGKPFGLSIISHYVNLHPLSEVLTSRLAPTAGTLFRNSGEVNACVIVRHRKLLLFKQFCFFCNTYKCISKTNWIKHLARHSGYYQYKCVDCLRKFCLKNGQHVCKNKNNIVEIPQPQFEKQKIIAYVCDLCNFVRFHKIDIIKHLNCEHDENIENVTKRYTRGVFLSFPQRKLKAHEELETDEESYDSKYEEEETDEEETDEEETDEEETEEEETEDDSYSDCEESEEEWNSEFEESEEVSESENNAVEAEIEEEYEREMMQGLGKELTEEMAQNFEELQEYDKQLDNGEFYVPELNVEKSIYEVGCEVEVTDNGEMELANDYEMELTEDHGKERMPDCNGQLINGGCDQNGFGLEAVNDRKLTENCERELMDQVPIEKPIENLERKLKEYEDQSETMEHDSKIDVIH